MPPWRNIDTIAESSTFLSAKPISPAAPHTRVSLSAMVRGSPDRSSQATAARSYSRSSISRSVPDMPFCQEKKTKMLAAISATVMIGKILVGLMSRKGNMGLFRRRQQG